MGKRVGEGILRGENVRVLEICGSSTFAVSFRELR